MINVDVFIYIILVECFLLVDVVLLDEEVFEVGFLEEEDDVFVIVFVIGLVFVEGLIDDEELIGMELGLID